MIKVLGFVINLYTVDAVATEIISKLIPIALEYAEGPEQIIEDINFQLFDTIESIDVNKKVNKRAYLYF